MAQILPNDTIAERLGQGLGSGFQTGLNTLLNYKIQQMTQGAERDRAYNNLVGSGYDPATARFISGFDPKDQVKLLTNLWQRGYNPTAAGQIPNNVPENIQNTMAPLGNNEPVQPQIEQVLAPQQAKPESIAQLFAQQAPNFALGGNSPMNAATLGAIGELSKGLNREVPQAPRGAPQGEQVDMNLRQQQPGIKQGQKPLTPAELLSKAPPPSPDTQARLNQQEEQFNKKFKHDLNKEASKFIDSYSDKADASRANIRDYDIIINGAKSGNLRAGNTQILLDKFGLGDFNKNLTTAIVEKSMARLGQNAQSAFGTGRLTNLLEQTYQRSLPRLWNTPEGIVAISEINKLMEEANLLKEQEAVNVLKENGGEKPFNAKQQVNQRVQPKIDDLTQRAINILEPQKYNILSVVENLPSARDNKGKKFRNPQTGEIVKSNGIDWIKE